ncbi:uncharacterized protein [Centruroides vittatus]|uniref:uncharacterized protein n=1 Tax=Centruroides vittatus TaxID=120091 RepID=UPI00350FA5A0
MIAEIERGLLGMDEIEKEYFRWKAAFRSEKYAGKRKEWTDIKRAKKWLTDNGLIITRADKSKHLVVMKKQRYVEALEDYIRKTEYERVEHDIVRKIEGKVKRLEKSPLASIFPFLKGAHVTNPGVPRLFGFAKTHKTNKEIRPVVEKCKGPTYKLEKRMHSYLSELIGDHQFVTKNPMNVVQELQGLALMDNEVGSVMDFESMYPSIKPSSCFDALMEVLYSLHPTAVEYRKDLEMMANLVCVQSFFVFEGKVYKQLKGVPMGSPMSGLLCELVVRKMERITLNNFKEDIIMYKRYVDDVLVIWRNHARIQQFLSAMNSNDHGLKLSLEQVSSDELHFLDISIAFRNGSIDTKVYIKPTHDPLYIPSTSNDPITYKLSAFRALIRRAFQYCSNILDTMRELDRIRQVAKVLGFGPRTVERLIAAYRNPKVNKKKRDLTNGITKFTYNKRLSSVMEGIAGRMNSTIVYKRAPSIYRLLRNDKDAIRPSEQPGVYSIPYSNDQLKIDKEYIGVTTRSLSKRIKEHRYDVAKGKCTTTLAKMAQTEGSVVKWDEARILTPIHSPTLAATTEKCEIYKSGLTKKCLNYKDAAILPSAWKFLIKKVTGIH